MAVQEKRRPDRRAAYTKNAIKDALLELMEEKPFDKLSVSSVSTAAEVTRTTFYAHYDSLNDVLDELILDALELAEYTSSTLSLDAVARIRYLLQFDTVEKLREHNSDLPPCQRIADDPKYRVLFLDSSVSQYIQNKIFLLNKDSAVSSIMEYCLLSEAEAQWIFRYMLSGAYEVNASMGWVKDDAWYAMRLNLIRMEAAAYDALRAARLTGNGGIPPAGPPHN